MNTVYLFLAEGFEETEAITPVDIVRRAEIAVVTVSISGSKTVVGAHQIPIIADQLFEDTDFANDAILVLPGGLAGMQNLKAHKGLTELLDKQYATGKEIAAICASPSILGERGMLAGKEAICYPGFEGKLQGATISKLGVIKDKNIITGKGPGYSIQFGLKIVEIVKGKEKADEIAAQFQFVR